MGHVTSQPDWGTLDIDTTAGVILVREDWQYTWDVLGVGITPWTYQEKRRFHHRLDNEIWGRWSGHFKVKVKGTTDVAKRFASSAMTLDFDIHWVLSRGQWQVTVHKVDPATSPNAARPNVTFAKKKIELYSTIFRPYTAGNDAHKSRPNFVAGPHEFGHTFDNPDEYLLGNPHLGDTDSLMNVGKQLRDRHVQLVLDQLNTMIPGTTFYV